jgi:hypothetical protein
MNVSIVKTDARVLKDVMSELPVRQANIMEFCTKTSVPLWRGEVDGQLACIWGLIPGSLLSDHAYIWLYTTELVQEHQFIFVRYSQLMIKEMLKEYEFITGNTVAGEDRSIRWLKWLGAEFGMPKGKLIPFVIRRK